MLLPLLVLTLQSSWGQAPAGLVNFSFNSTTTAVYDLSSPGGYEFDQNIIGAGGTQTPLSIPGVVLTHSRTGRLYGRGLIQVGIGTDGSAVAAYYTANGQVSGGGNHPVKVHLSLHLSGNDVVAGVMTGFSISVNYNFVVDQGSMSMIGPAKGRASFTKLSGGRIDTENVAVPLQPGVDGTWSAQLDVTAMSRLGGSGDLVLSNGRIVPVRLSGNYMAGSQRSNLRATGYFASGDYDGRGSSVLMRFFPGATGSDVAVSGTVLGQKVVQ